LDVAPRHLRIAIGGVWIEAPLQHVAGEALGARQLAVRGALQLRADVDQDRAIVVGRVRLSGRQAIQLRPRLIEQLLDCQLGFGIGAFDL
jgi:hypothetical protein